jgi:transcriptional regulator with XRE-family HTH domain
MGPGAMIGERMIGSRIRRLRRERGLTQESLAKAAGLSKGYLSRIENSTGAPPVSTLFGIASALGVGIEVFFALAREQSSFVVTRRNMLPQEPRQATNQIVSLAVASSFPGRHMEPRVVRLPAGAGRLSEPPRPCEEIRFVLAGRLRLELGHQTVVLEEGDCIYFNASTPVACEGADGSEASYLGVSLVCEEAGGGGLHE